MTTAQIAHVIHVFGPELYWGWNGLVGNPDWHTGDGVLPWKMFVLIQSDLEHVWAAGRLLASQATSMAVALAFSDKKGGVERELDRWVDQAFPKVS